MQTRATAFQRADSMTEPGAGIFCTDCGYNLRGIDSERCPECGIYQEGVMDKEVLKRQAQ